MPTLQTFLDGYRNREAQLRSEPTQQLQQIGTLQGILAKQQAAQREAQYRDALGKLGPNATQDDMLGVARQFMSADDLGKMITSSQDRRASAENTKQVALQRLQQQLQHESRQAYEFAQTLPLRQRQLALAEINARANKAYQAGSLAIQAGNLNYNTGADTSGIMEIVQQLRAQSQAPVDAPGGTPQLPPNVPPQDAAAFLSARAGVPATVDRQVSPQEDARMKMDMFGAPETWPENRTAPAAAPAPTVTTAAPVRPFADGLDARDLALRGMPSPGTSTPIQNSDGTVTTERSITVTDPRLNGGRPTNIPSVWNGRVVAENEAVSNALASGRKWDSFSTIPEAVSAARARSNSLGAGTQTSIGGASGVGGEPQMPQFSGSPAEQARAKNAWLLAKAKAEIKADVNVAGGRESVFINRVVMSGNQAAADLENVVKLPFTVSRGVFGGREQGPGLFEAGKETLANTMTTEEVQLYNVVATGFQRALAAIEGAGLAPTNALMNQMDAIIFKEGDTNFAKLTKLAQTRQIVEKGLETITTNSRVDPATKQHASEIIAKVQKAVPFTVANVIELREKQQKNPTVTLSDVMGGMQKGGDWTPEKERRYQELLKKRGG